MAEHPLVERVAREMYKASPWVGHHTYEKVPWETMHPDVHADYMKQARAAIRAVLTWGYDGELTDDEVQAVDWPWPNTNYRMDPTPQKVAARESATVVNAALLRDIEACIRGGDGVG